MVALDSSLTLPSSEYFPKINQCYHDKVLQENEKFKRKHGVGPYAYQGRFADRVLPYLDAGYYHGLYLWLKEEYGATYDRISDTFTFSNEKELILFVLKWG